MAREAEIAGVTSARTACEIYRARLAALQYEGAHKRVLQRGLVQELERAEAKAWDALSRHRFQMFGHWAAIWVHLNRLGQFHRKNPWRDLIVMARGRAARPPATAPVRKRRA